MRSNLILQPGTASATNSANDEHDGVPPPLIGSPHFPVLGGGQLACLFSNEEKIANSAIYLTNV